MSFKSITTTIMASIVGFSISFSAQGEMISEDSNYIYQKVPYKQAFSSDEDITWLVSSALQVIQSTLAELDEKGAFENSSIPLLDSKGIKEMQKTDRQIARAIGQINGFVDDQREKFSFFTELDVLRFSPDAIVVFAGKRFTAKWKIGVGASGVVGFVIAPMKTLKIDRLTGEVVSTSYTPDVDIVFWGSPDLSLGKGAEVRRRVGFGLVWGLDQHFDSASDFRGFGGGVSITKNKLKTPGRGYNLKAGILNDDDTPGAVNSFYANIAWEYGLGDATGAPHLNATMVMPLEKVMELFSKASDKAARNYDKKLIKDITKIIGKGLAGGIPLEADLEADEEAESEGQD